MAQPQRKQLALDTNILFDLAQPLDAAHDFRETFLAAKYALRVPPTAVQELVFASEDEEEDPEDRRLASLALSSMAAWGVNPFDLVAVGHGITDAFAEKLLKKGLLPDSEYNDGLILAETSLAGIPFLVTRDGHLLDIDETHLSLTFDECDMPHVRPCHPKPLLRAMR
jgi:predicted nucleic acid-binding protein